MGTVDGEPNPPEAIDCEGEPNMPAEGCPKEAEVAVPEAVDAKGFDFPVVVANGFDFEGPDDEGGKGLVVAKGDAKGFGLEVVVEDGKTEFVPNGFVNACVCAGVSTIIGDTDFEVSFEGSTDPALA